MIDLKKYEAWFVTGSQHLYGEKVLRQVTDHSKQIVKSLSNSKEIPIKVIFKPVVTSSESIFQLFLEANSSPSCVGIITWMHTFSPAKMWIAGLKILQKPLVHLHTQFNVEIPWGTIDMDFMNLNQSAHGDREFGHICTRLGLPRKVIVGHWQDKNVHKKLNTWMRAACAKIDLSVAKIARFGDNMRDVAVTEGDKVEAQIKFGFSVNGYGVGELVKFINHTTNSEVNKLLAECEEKYLIVPSLKKSGEKRQSLIDALKIEAGLRRFLKEGNFKGFTTTFEDLFGLTQLPGLAVQRLMAEGYGFGAEGDWKISALVRAMKVMAAGLKGGTSFMEDYTYHLSPAQNTVLGAHMLEVCESLAKEKPRLEIHPLSIGGKADPPRLVFNSQLGKAVNATLIDCGERFRMIVNEVTSIPPEKPLQKLPVARVLWIPKPNLQTAAESWIYSGGAHHTCFSLALTSEYLEDFCEMCSIEFLLINESTQTTAFKKELKWNDIYYSRKK